MNIGMHKYKEGEEIEYYTLSNKDDPKEKSKGTVFKCLNLETNIIGYLINPPLMVSEESTIFRTESELPCNEKQ